MNKKQLLSTAILSFGSLALFAQTSRVQVIHNSADAAAATVDVYANNNLFLDNVDFRTASAFVDVPAGVPITIGIAPGNSTSAAQSIFTATATFDQDSVYVVVANGIVSASGYSPATPFGLNIYNMGREAATVATNTDVLVMHGSTDAPVVDVRPMGSAAPLVDDISFGEFSNYLELPTADYVINVTTSDGETIAGSFQAPLETLSLNGASLVVVASGFLNPSSNNNGPAFGLWAALPTGGPLVELPINTTARLQAIHNSADAAAAVVDVYADTALLLDDFAFRTASPYVDVPAGVAIELGVAPSTSTSSTEAIYTQSVTLEAGKAYVLVASGIVSATGYTPTQPFSLVAYDMARESASNPSNTDILVMHGCTDAPTVDIKAGTATLVDDISFGEFADAYLELPTMNYTLSLTLADGSTLVNNYDAPLQTLNLAGKSLVAVASGFLDTAANSNSPNAFGLWVALSDGGPLVALPLTGLSVNDLVKQNSNFNLYPVPAKDELHVKSEIFTNATAKILELSGRVVDVQQNIGNKPVSTSHLPTGTYILMLDENGKTGYKKFQKL